MLDTSPTAEHLPSLVDLGSDDVHVWHASLDRVDLERCAATLSADEHARAARFRFRQDRDRFVAARGLLRAILGRYLDRAPETLRFRYGRRGKPSLSPATVGVALRFNVSHAGDLALVAVTRSREVGIDIERIRADIDLDLLIETSCSAAEIVSLNACGPQDRAAAFFTYWTLKEAYLKGVGDGLHCSPDRLSVHHQDSARPFQLLYGGRRVEDWTLQSLAVAPGFVAAIAIQGHDFALSRRCWP